MHLVILGTGSHARMLKGCLSYHGVTSECVDLDAPLQENTKAIIGIGASDLWSRRRRFLERPERSWTRHFYAGAAGTFVGMLTVLGVSITLGDNVVVYSGCILEHETHIADHAFLGPGVVCCGGVQIGEGAFIGANATLLPNIRIGAWARVGAGAVVTHDVPDRMTVKGVPAR